MSWINRLEAKFGRFGIPNLIQTLAGFQLLVYFLGFMPGYLDVLTFSPIKILDGQVWRLVTWLLVAGYGHPLWALIGTFFAMFMGNHLEHAWGSFRTTVFVFGSGAALIASAWLLHFLQPGVVEYLGPAMFSWWIFSSLFLSFAVLFPDLTIRLYFFIPIKLKWLGLISGALILARFVEGPNQLRLLILSAHIAFLGFALPLAIRQLKQRQKVAVRRAKFEKDLPAESEAFHTCDRCGKTDQENPRLDFRVTPDGEELCSACLKAGVGGGGQ